MRIPQEPLGRRRKRLCLSVIAFGLCTFFLPMVILHPAVMGRTEWSPWDIAQNIYVRKLPVSGGMFDDGLLQIATIYVLMLFALVALYIPGPPHSLRVIGGIGFALSVVAKFWNTTLLWTFGYFGHMSQWLCKLGGLT